MGAHQSHYNCENFVSWKDSSKNQCGETIIDHQQNYARGIANNGVSPTCWIDKKHLNANEVYYKVNNQYYGQRTHGLSNRQPGDYILPVGGGKLPMCDVNVVTENNSILLSTDNTHEASIPKAGDPTGEITGNIVPGTATSFMRSDAAPALQQQKFETDNKGQSGYRTIVFPTPGKETNTNVWVNANGIIYDIFEK